MFSDSKLSYYLSHYFSGTGTAAVTLVLALIGKVGASSGFHLAYQYSAELFPTVVRNAGMGSSSCMARVGGILAPLVADLVYILILRE